MMPITSHVVTIHHDATSIADERGAPRKTGESAARAVYQDNIMLWCRV